VAEKFWEGEGGGGVRGSLDVHEPLDKALKVLEDVLACLSLDLGAPAPASLLMLMLQL